MAQHSTRFLKLVQDALQTVPEVSIHEVKSKLDSGDKLLLIDCREDHEWEAGRIPGATHLGRGIIERDIEQLVTDFDREIVIYCGGGYRSALAAHNLMRMGYDKVKSMAGGWRSWCEAKHETTKS